LPEWTFDRKRCKRISANSNFNVIPNSYPNPNAKKNFSGKMTFGQGVQIRKNNCYKPKQKVCLHTVIQI